MSLICRLILQAWTSTMWKKGESFIFLVLCQDCSKHPSHFFCWEVFSYAAYVLVQTCILRHTRITENELKLAHIHSAVLPCLWYTWPSFIVFFFHVSLKDGWYVTRLERYIEYMCMRHTLEVIDEAERKNTKSPPVPTHLSRETLICPDFVHFHGSIRSRLTEIKCLVQPFVVFVFSAPLSWDTLTKSRLSLCLILCIDLLRCKYRDACWGFEVHIFLMITASDVW